MENSKQNIRQMIVSRSEELRGVTELSPQRVAEILIELSSLLASLNAHIAEKKYLYNVLLDTKLTELGVASKAKISAQASLEWKEMNEVEMQKEALEETIRSGKYFLRSKEEEWRNTR